MRDSKEGNFWPLSADRLRSESEREVGWHKVNPGVMKFLTSASLSLLFL